MTPIINNGIDIERERREQDGSELKVGAITSFLFKAPESERRRYLPQGELQFTNKGDMMDCASRDKLNILETDLTYAYRNGLLSPETKAFLEPCVVVKDGLSYIEMADAYTAIKSGTTKAGNSLKSPAQSLHENGFAPKKWIPLEEWMTFEDYHNPKRITPEIEAFAAESKKRLPINYQQVQNWQFKDELHRGALSTAGHAWDIPVNGIYQRSDGSFNHAFDVFENEFFAFDNYLDVDGDFIKQLAPDFRFFDWGYQIGFTGQNLIVQTPPAPDIELSKLEKAIQAVIDFINANWNALFPAPMPPQNPPMPPQAPATPVPPQKYLWDTPDHARHSVRLICDEEGLSLTPTESVKLPSGIKYFTPKDVLCACIRQESNFNPKAIGKLNFNLTRDYGLCQYNDGKNKYGQAYWIGKGAPFKDIEEVLNNPEKNVRVMIKQFKAGNLKLWASFSTGAFKKYLPGIVRSQEPLPNQFPSKSLFRRFLEWFGI